MDEDVERLYSIEGQPPALWDLPPGCRFASRCPHADDRCRAEYPPSYKVGEGHTADCWLLEKAGSRVEDSSKQEAAA
jgi:oligopeptide/dipeptide ABC transporter ATP-binding protein